MTKCFDHYYATVCARRRPEGMDMHPRMVAYRFCAQYPIAARFFTQDRYKMFLFRSYARTMRDIATGLEDQEEVAEILFDCHFCTILEEVAEKVWQHFNP